MEVLENQQLQDFVSMKLGGPAQFLVHVHTEQEVVDAVTFAKEKDVPLTTLGTGTNVVFSDKGFKGLILVNEIQGIAFDDSGKITIGAGENWDEVVKKTVDAGFIGIEAMSLIPGTVGATPVNNVGAYGQEIADTLVSVRAYDTVEGAFVDIPNEACKFAYRTSRFKSEDYGRFIISSVTLQLLPYVTGEYAAPEYPALLAELKTRGIETPTPADVREAVIAVRTSKLPDPKTIANVGSFFKNPIVAQSVARSLQSAHPDMPVHDYGEMSKLSAGWLIEHAGLKGERKHGIYISDKQALVLINESAKTFAELTAMVTYIQKSVKDKFGVELEPEPELL